jgi:CTP synthase
VEVVPHVPEELIRRLKQAARKDEADIVLSEIGGTVGEYQNILFLEADRMLKREHANDVANIHVSYLPIPQTVGEMKTKPVQYSIRTLQSAGIQPEFVVCRSSRPLDEKRKEKIALFGNVEVDNIISNHDVESIYEVPLIFEKQRFAEKILKALKLPKKRTTVSRGSTVHAWNQLVKKIKRVDEPVKIGIIGKYFDTGDFVLEDSYISVIEAIKHAVWAFNRKPVIQWLDAKNFERGALEELEKLKECDGIIVPGGFGKRGIEGKINAINFARIHKIPYLGLCYGMQLAVVEFARNVLQLEGAHTEEIEPKTKYPIIHTLPEQLKLIAGKKYGATMRLGAYSCVLDKSSQVFSLYKKNKISERHRHRYEFNNEYRDSVEKAGLKVSGVNPERNLVEIVELADHPYFVGVQFHPEFESRPLSPHPLFVGLVKAGIKRRA